MQADSISAFRSAPKITDANFADVVIEGKEADYVKNTIGVAIILLVLTILWYLLILIFKCCYPKNLKFLGGRKLIEGSVHNKTVRISFLLCALLALASVLQFSLGGTNSLIDLLDFFYDELKNLLDYLDKGLAVLSAMATDLVALATTTGTLATNIENLNCEVMDDELAALFGSIADTINDSDFLSYTDDIEKFDSALQDGFRDAETTADDIVQTAQDIARPVYRIVGIFIITVEALLMVGVVLSWMKWTNKCISCCERFVIMPVLTLVGLLSLIFSCVMSMFLILLSDACAGGQNLTPEETMTDILDNDNVRGAVRSLIDYYIVDGCRGGNPFPVIGDVANATANLTLSINEAMEQIGDELGLEQLCPGYNEVESSLSEVSVLLGNIGTGVADGSDLLDCDVINPFYVSWVHEGACDKLPGFLYVNFVTLTIVWATSLFMILFRSALLRSEHAEEPEKEISHHTDDGDDPNKDTDVKLY